MTLTVAVGELTRVLPWSLRALGYPFGTADRAAHVVARAAALDPSVLDRIAQAGTRPEGGARPHRGPEGLCVEARGCSLFETGPAVVDHLAAHSAGAPVVSAQVTGAADPELLPAIVLIGADYGLTAVAVEPQASGGGWCLAAPMPEGTRLFRGRGGGALLAGLRNDDLAAAIEAAGDAPGLVLFATERPVGLSFAEPGTDAASALARANARGIPVSRPTLQALYALEMITWAPTSERSRAQAGFTPKAAPA